MHFLSLLYYSVCVCVCLVECSPFGFHKTNQQISPPIVILLFFLQNVLYSIHRIICRVRAPIPFNPAILLLRTTPSTTTVVHRSCGICGLNFAVLASFVTVPALQLRIVPYELLVVLEDRVFASVRRGAIRQVPT